MRYVAATAAILMVPSSFFLRYLFLNNHIKIKSDNKIISMLEIPFKFFYMTRMLKDKLLGKITEYYYGKKVWS